VKVIDGVAQSNCGPQVSMRTGQECQTADIEKRGVTALNSCLPRCTSRDSDGSESSVIVKPIPNRRAWALSWLAAKGKSNAQYLWGMLRGVQLFCKYHSRTMIHLRGFIENLGIMNVALGRSNLKDGAIVECGTWKGGMAAAMIETGGPKRHYYFFDSFEGLPPAKDIDGPSAKRWQADVTSPTYFDNCSASLEEFRHTLEMTGCTPDVLEVHKGFFENTLPTFDCPPVAILRLDADLYDSTMICLEKFWSHVMPGGLIVIDDYYAFEGCARAVHAFLAKQQASERIFQGPLGLVAFILKHGLPSN